MNRRVVLPVLITFLLVGMFVITAVATAENTFGSASVVPVKNIESLKLFQAKKFDAHYRTPNTEQIERILKEEGIPLTGVFSSEARTHAFKKEWARRNPTTVNPQKLRKLLDRERLGARAAAPAAPTEYKSLVVPVEFPNSDEFDHCGVTVTTSGPLHNQMAAPRTKGQQHRLVRGCNARPL